MKKLLLLMVFTGLMSCENEGVEEIPLEASIFEDITSKKNQKVDVCHKGKIINVSINAVSAHQGHGDAVDMDGDGYFDIENDCSEMDCDDSDSTVNPSAEEICDNGIDDNCNGEVDEGCLAIGDSYEGGIIFYLDDSGQHGLVAAPYDIGPFGWSLAIQQCEILEIDDYDDWYLPTQMMLNWMYTNLHLQGLGNFQNLFYWSATEASASHAWGVLFIDGNPWAVRKDVLRQVRAVRAF